MYGTAPLMCVHSPGIQTQVGWLPSYGGQRLSERPKLCEKWVAEGGEEAIDGQAKGGGGAIDGLSAWATCPSRASSQAVLEGQLGQEEVQRMQEKRKGGQNLRLTRKVTFCYTSQKQKCKLYSWIIFSQNIKNGKYFDQTFDSKCHDQKNFDPD